MIRAIALDDEPLALKIIESFCNRIDYIQLEKTFTKTSEAAKYLRKQPVDLIFLDIQMPTQNGLSFYKQIEQATKVIFTTAFSEYAVEGFNVNASDYLLKPFPFSRFSDAVAKVKEQLDMKNNFVNSENNYLYIRADYSLHKILLEDILFIEGLDDYLKIHLVNQKTIVARMTMKVMSEKLPSNKFARVHRSYIISISKMEKIRNKMIYITSYEIPLSTTYEEGFFSKINL
ncbi:LytR/AlgR family response regulator transcription factor [Flavobacterium sp. SM2513]|uniref:LytR/AlgR family response regulator transcription factor n=1 Tax=Flavobacterium sp. SM2513 TaxID=3424766 RepID=UPI003D7FC425